MQTSNSNGKMAVPCNAHFYESINNRHFSPLIKIF